MGTQNTSLFLRTVLQQVWLTMQECYRCLPRKTTAFFLAVHAKYQADWVLKMDDDVYLTPPRLPLAMAQWDHMKVEYIGCMKHGEVHMDPENKWYEPAWPIIGERNHLHAYGSIYSVQGRVVDNIVAPNSRLLRYIANEGAALHTPTPLPTIPGPHRTRMPADTTFGLWMLAFNVTFFEDMRLCSPKCHPHAVAFLDNNCSGLCNPVNDMYRLSKMYFCHRPIAAGSRLSFMPSSPTRNRFDILKDYNEVLTTVRHSLHPRRSWRKP
jgi:Galactosyltransferase